MNVLLINGSPHKNGCTNAALAEVAKTLNEAGIETTIFHIGAAPVGGCASGTPHGAGHRRHLQGALRPARRTLPGPGLSAAAAG